MYTMIDKLEKRCYTKCKDPVLMLIRAVEGSLPGTTACGKPGE